MKMNRVLLVLIICKTQLLNSTFQHQVKRLDIIRKTWKKMSARAQEFALSGNLKLPEPLIPSFRKRYPAADKSKSDGRNGRGSCPAIHKKMW